MVRESGAGAWKQGKIAAVFTVDVVIGEKVVISRRGSREVVCRNGVGMFGSIVSLCPLLHNVQRHVDQNER